MAIVVPAHDEAETITACVESIRAACAAVAATTVIVVVADGCDDDTAQRARRALGRAGVVIDVDLHSAGAARRAGVDAALELVGSGAGSTWIANTDADSTVPPGWLGAQLQHAARGAAAVSGIVRLRADHELAALFAAHYAWDPRRPHPHVHGANLGVRVDAYEAVGGWPTVPMSEDHALWRRLRAGGWPVVAATDVWVETSARLVGRVDGGFNGDLRRLTNAQGA